MISYSRDDTVINTQNLTTTTAPDGTITVVGDGRVENTHDSTRSADGGGSVSEHTTWVTTSTDIPSENPWNTTTTHDYWNVRNVNQSYDRTASYSTVDTYGVIGNVYTLLQHDDNSYSLDNNDSTVDIMTRNKESTLSSRPNGNLIETFQVDADSMSHTVSISYRTQTLTDNQSDDAADPSNNSSERSGGRTESTKQTTDNDNTLVRVRENSSASLPAYYEEHNDYHSVDEVNGEHTVGSEPADDDGSTTHSGSLGGASRYRYSSSDPFVEYPVVPSQADPTYEETVADNDDNPPAVPQPHQALKTSTPPLTNAASPVSAPSENPHAATDQALLQLTGDDAEQGSPQPSTVMSPEELAAWLREHANDQISDEMREQLDRLRSHAESLTTSTQGSGTAMESWARDRAMGGISLGAHGNGIPAGSYASQPTTRPLTAGEIALLRSVFGNYLDLRGLRLGNGPLFPGGKDNSMTPRYTPWFPSDKYSEDFSKEPSRKHHFIHEMTHVLQSQNGNWNWLDGPYHWGKNFGTYKLAYPYDHDDLGKPLYHFNFEQQADIVADYFTGRLTDEERERCKITIRGFRTQLPSFVPDDRYLDPNYEHSDNSGWGHPIFTPKPVQQGEYYGWP